MKAYLPVLCFLLSCMACTNNLENHAKAVSEKQMDELRARMVETQIRARGIQDPLVLHSLQITKRHEFVSPAQARDAYEDGPLPIGEGQTISQPYIVAIMTELAHLTKDSRVLEVGTGSGYQAAVLAAIAKEVYSIEIVESLGKKAAQKLTDLGYKNVQVRIGDGYRGWPEAAPFDAILVTAAPDHIPQPLVDQLKTGGRLVIPVGDFYQELEVITKQEEGIKREKVIPVRFVPMTGEAEKN